MIEELKQEFLNEAEELLAEAEEAFLDIKSIESNPEHINRVFRLAHNIKGSARAVGFGHIAELTHHAENILLKLKEGSIKVTDELAEALLLFKDTAGDIIECLREDIDSDYDISMPLAKLIAVLENGSSNVNSLNKEEKEEKEEKKETPATKGPEQHGIENFHLFDDEPEKEEKPSLNDTPVKKEPVAAESTPTKTPQKKASKTNIDESVRVKLSRINKLTNLVGELVIFQTVLEQRSGKYISDEIATSSIKQMSKIFKETQEIAMSLRMLPLKPTFQKLTRIIFDTSKALGKKIEFESSGELTEVDKTVLEKISDPLVHIVRNAVDHGIEKTEQQRIKAGKDPAGLIRLEAFHEGGNLIICVIDDGGGIDPAVIRKKAIEKGVISEDTNISDSEAQNLIFHAGFSTAEKVTEVSGRGVGMDVVKSNLLEVGGEINVISEVNEGSIFKIVLPLTLAITEGLIVKCRKENFVIALAQVHEIVQIKRAEIDIFQDASHFFYLRGDVVPFFFLSAGFGSKGDLDSSNIFTVIIVRTDDGAFGVCVDEVIAQQQIVIKKLGDEIDINGVIGAAILGDGRPAFIVDLLDLFGSSLMGVKAA